MKWKDRFSRKTRIILTVIMIAVFTALGIYVVGLASQIVARFVFQKVRIMNGFLYGILKAVGFIVLGILAFYLVVFLTGWF